ncbi:MAG TPA: NAD(P)H-hydrate epimerase [Candidatus Hydrogenedentes bacterium]|nr:NAD(P)H-hydrate epimerase [Candidatus Hydrogenedentota bacterium]HIJ73030.1 NAD(P)H-hydrate epimerase [Candidatus Hydrogenedentota bacterium]
MKTLTAAQMREADRRCIEDLGIPGVVLMNNAGAAVFREIDKGPVGVVCGRGNNGGDGFVVARLALLAGHETRVVLVANHEDVRGDAATFMNVYTRLGGRFTSAPDEAEAEAAVAALEDCAVLIDALLGTGVRGHVRGPIRAAIEAWPRVHTIAVDLPSGLDTDSGERCGCCVKADTTVTFQFPKKGFENPAARELVGRLVVADIGIPAACADNEAWGRLTRAQRQNPAR